FVRKGTRNKLTRLLVVDDCLYRGVGCQGGGGHCGPARHLVTSHRPGNRSDDNTGRGGEHGGRNIAVTDLCERAARSEIDKDQPLRVEAAQHGRVALVGAEDHSAMLLMLWQGDGALEPAGRHVPEVDPFTGSGDRIGIVAVLPSLAYLPALLQMAESYQPLP